MSSKVLIVDDNPDILALLRANLRAAGFETDEALNGEAALRYVTKPFNVAGLVDLVHSIGRPTAGGGEPLRPPTCGRLGPGPRGIRRSA